MKRFPYMLLVLIIVPLFLLGGCSKKSTTTDNPTNNVIDVQLANYQALVEEIAPPEYAVGLAKPAIELDSARIDTFWYWGNNPLLGKVFGTEESMSLYTNIAELDQIVDQINAAFDSVKHFGVDTVTITVGIEHMVVEAVVDLESLTTPVAIPENCQPVMGFSTIDLDYHLKFWLTEDTAIGCQLGFKSDANEESFLSFRRMPHGDNPNEFESCLFYAHRDKATDAIEIKEVFFKDYGDSTKAIWVFQIKTVNENDFLYRMSWYADDFGDTSGLACIIGGGNKDEQFALRYNQYRPADRGELDPQDPYGDLSRFFGPNYANLGDSIPDEFVAITDPDSMYHYDDLPMELLNNPLEAPNMINPWGNH
jgi:hypothetical protein